MELAKDLAAQLLELLKTTKDFVLEQAPDVIQQLVLYKRAVYLCGLLAAIVVSLIVWQLAKKLNTEMKNGSGDEAVLSFCAVGSFVGGVLVLVFVPISIHGLLLWSLAPKVALLEYLALLIN